MSQEKLEGIDNSFNACLEEVFALVAAPDTPWTEKDKGDWFEQAVVKILNSEEGRKLWGIEWAVLWGDWIGQKNGTNSEDDSVKGYPSVDLGIDIVAKLRTGRKMAVQCKVRPEDKSILKNEIAPILAYAVEKDWEKVLLVHTGKDAGHHAKELAEQHSERFQMLNRSQLGRICKEWKMRFPRLGEKWPSVIHTNPTKHSLLPHQTAAIRDVLAGFQTAERGTLVMPCGSGKTLTSQRIAEQLVGKGGAVLVAVPSISLLSQSMKEWSIQQDKVGHRYLGVCSDISAGKIVNDEFQQTIQELDIPATTNSKLLQEEMRRNTPEEMLVIFSTYQSLPKVQDAQKKSGLIFGLVLCDEAHRTTGIAQLGLTKEQKKKEALTGFQRIHEDEWINTKKRLYMTATPKIYTDPTSKKELTASGENVYSMSDQSIYGKVFHELSFANAVEQNLLSHYNVVLVGCHSEAEAEKLNQHILSVRKDQTGKEVKIDGELAAKVLGATKFAANYSSETEAEPRPGEGTLKKMLVFANSIASSKNAAVGFDYGDDMLAELDDDWASHGVEVEAKHMDGTFPADKREQDLEWLRSSEDPNVCRIISNVRCLTEGIDVPALDGCVFLEGRKSKVDVVQAVGRIMRRTETKKCGWVILPVLTSVPQETADADIIEQQNYISKQWKPAWDVLRALAAHDDSFRIEVAATAAAIAGGKIPAKGSGRIHTAGTLDPDSQLGDMDREVFNRLSMEKWEKVSELIYPVVVTQLGGKIALDTAGEVAGKLTSQVRTLIRNTKNKNSKDYNEAAAEALDRFRGKMKVDVSSKLTASQVDDMVAQHVVMAPVFEAFFVSGSFKSGNPMVQAMDNLTAELSKAGLDLEQLRETEMGGFYAQVRATVESMDGDPAAFQGYLKSVWNAFFRAPSFKPWRKKLGIAYTPIELVDFVNRSADWILRSEFPERAGSGLGGENVSVIDPFSGAGTFIARMLGDSTLIPDGDVPRKYTEELYAAELVLLAYYIGAVNIEQVYHRRRGSTGKALPFTGAVLQDTFESFRGNRLPGTTGNAQRAEELAEAPVQAIVGNPPYSIAAEKDSKGKTIKLYPELDKAIDEKLVKPAGKKGRMSKNSYVKAMVWAEDRLKEGGVVGYIIPCEWLTAPTGEGIRRWISGTFGKAWIVDLQGNCKTIGDDGRRQGAPVFGNDCQSPIAVVMLAKHQATSSVGQCDIKYTRVADYSKLDAKFGWLAEMGSVEDSSNLKGWETVTIDSKGRWFGEDTENWDDWTPLYGGEEDDVASVFVSNNLGITTGRDYLAYNFSKDKTAEQARGFVEAYEEHRQAGAAVGKDKLDVICGNEGTKKSLAQNKPVSFEESEIQMAMYRPFTPMFCHFSKPLSNAFPPFETYWNGGGERAILWCTTRLAEYPPDIHSTSLPTDTAWNSRAARHIGRFRYQQSLSTNRKQQQLQPTQTSASLEQELPVSGFRCGDGSQLQGGGFGATGDNVAQSFADKRNGRRSSGQRMARQTRELDPASSVSEADHRWECL